MVRIDLYMVLYKIMMRVFKFTLCLYIVYIYKYICATTSEMHVQNMHFGTKQKRIHCQNLSTIRDSIALSIHII